MYVSKHVENVDVNIHYYDSLESSDETLTPMIICPGLSETAEEYLDLLEAVLPRRCILISFRGRGQSDTPDHGYDLNDHISDIMSVVRDTGVELFHLFSYSRGVSYALGYTLKFKEKVKSLIVGDYPPEHRAMPMDWSEDYINNYLIPYDRTDHIRPKAVYGIQRESTQINLEGYLTMDVLVARGKLNDSLITDSDLLRYEKMYSKLAIKEYLQSGHDIKLKEKQLFYLDIVNFINQLK